MLAVTVIIFLWVVNTSVLFVEKCNSIKHNGTQSYKVALTLNVWGHEWCACCPYGKAC